MIAPGITEEGLDALLPRRHNTGLAQGIAATLQYYRAHSSLLS